MNYFKAAIAIAGISVAFPLAIGLTLVLGVLINYTAAQKGDPTLLFAGVALIVVAILLNAIAYKKKSMGEQKKVSAKGIGICITAGVLMAFFYRFVAAAMDLENFSTHMTGVLGGSIWGLGNSLNLIAAGKAGPAISYGLGQGATLIAALWGVFIWKEFRNSPRGTKGLLIAMFCFFIVGLGLLIFAGV